MRWYCAQTHPRQDLIAIHELLLQSFTVHYPTFIDADRQVPKPLFPSYLFVAFDMASDSWRSISGTPGIKRLFSTAAERPTPIRPGVVEGLIARAGQTGVIDARPTTPDLVGASVRITGGPFADLVGICSWASTHRIGLLLELFGERCPVEVPRSIVQAV